MYGGMGSAVTPDLSKGGEIDGDLVITGDFKVEGAGSFAYDEIIEGGLHVKQSSSGATAHTSADDLVVESSGDVGISLLSGASDNSLIHFGDSGDSNIGFLDYDHADNSLDIGVNASTRMTITSAGKVGIGTTSPSYGLHIDNKQLVVDYTGIGFGHRDDSNNQFRLFTNISSGVGELYIRNASDANKVFLTGNGNSYINGGNLGIGTSSPSQPLHIESNNNNSDASVIIKNNNVDGTCGISFRSGSANNITIGIEKIGNNFAMNTGVGLGSGTRLLTVTPNGSVGIGTSSPSYGKLEVYGNGADTTLAIHEDGGSHKAQLHFRSGGNDVKLYTSGADNKFHIDTESVSKAFTILSDGKTGIGTDSPSAKLHITDGTDAGIILQDSGESAGVGNARIRSEGGEIKIEGLNGSFATHKTILQANLNTGNTKLVGGQDTLSNVSVGGVIGINNSNNSASVRLGYSSTDTTFRIMDSSDGSTKLAIADTTGNIGIGTDSPSDYGTSATNLVIYEAGNAGLSIITGTSNTGNIHFGDGTSASSAERRGMIRYDHSSDDFIFWTAGSEKLRITDDGNVGIGTTSPNNTVEISDTDARLRIVSERHNTNDGNSNNYTFFGYDSNGQKPFIISNQSDTPIVFRQGGGAERMRIHAGGNVGIGTSSPSGDGLTGGASPALEVEGTFPVIQVSDTDNANYKAVIGTNSGIVYLGGVGTATTATQLYVAGNIKFKLDDNSRISLSNNDSGTDNTVFGASAGNNLASGGNNNTFFGDLAGHTNSTGDDNTYIGKSAGQANSGTGDDNTFVGSHSGYQLTGGSDNTAIGRSSLLSITSGVTNVAVGSTALLNATTASNNVSIGFESAKNITIGGHNIAIGREALISEDVGDRAIGIGSYSLYTQNSDSNNEVSGNIGIGYASGFYNVTGTNNTNIGYYAGAGASGQSNSNNTSVGYEALKLITTGSDNVAVGSSAGYDLTTGTGNVTIGKGSGEKLTTASYNTFVNNGVHATGLTGGITTGNSNVGIGYASLTKLTSGASNVGIGVQAGMGATTASNNITIGFQTGLSLVAGQNNILMGYRAGDAGDFSNIVAIGYNAGTAISSGDANQSVLIGYNTGASITEAQGTTAVGSYALDALTTGDYNTAFGYQAGSAINTGGHNVAIGYNSSDAMTTGVENVAVGSNSLGQATGAVNFCTAIGHHALQGALDASGDNPSGATAVGAEAGNSLTVGIGFTGVGWRAGYNTTGADQATYIGYGAGFSGNGNHHNTYVGYKSGYGAGSGGEGNVGLGRSTLTVVNGGHNNVAVGNASLTALVTGDNNTAVGSGSGDLIQGGVRNSLFGKDSGDVLVAGEDNTILGYQADASGSSGSHQIVIGSGATGLGNNYAVIGNTDLTRLYVAQDGAGVLYANGTIQTSDKRLKENIQDSDLGLEFINKIRPVSYKYINDKQDGKTKYGIIAQEVQEVLKESNNEDFAGIKDSDEYLGADYNQFISPLIKAVQELSAEVKQLKRQLEDK